MKNKTSNREIKSLEREYKKILNLTEYSKHNNLGFLNHQWNNPNDVFVKFSLYTENPNSISSTDTLMVSSILN